MDHLNELRDWLYECDRLLFLAEVHYTREDVLPSEHRFAHKLTSSHLGEILDHIFSIPKAKVYYSESWIDPEEMFFLKGILDSISGNKLGYMDAERIFRARAIVHRFAIAVNADILENRRLCQYPPIYNACRIR